jgi:hypothetical protein
VAPAKTVDEADAADEDQEAASGEQKPRGNSIHDARDRYRPEVMSTRWRFSDLDGSVRDFGLSIRAGQSVVAVTTLLGSTGRVWGGIIVVSG